MRQEDCSRLSDPPPKNSCLGAERYFAGSEGVGICRTKMATSGVSDKLAEVGEIRRTFAAQRLEDNGGQFGECHR